jgi:hypothetical protein
MTAKKIIVALALLLGATSITWSQTCAQSQRNCGPSRPAQGNCFGQPYSGSAAARCTCGHWRR